MIAIIIFFLKVFMPKFLLSASIFFNIRIIYTCLKCINKQEKLSDNLTKKDNLYFFLSITYIFTYILI
jgi:hypothetical protein